MPANPTIIFDIETGPLPLAELNIPAFNPADVKLGKISISSPIARALIGKDEGDSVEVRTPGGLKSYEVIKIVYA